MNFPIDKPKAHQGILVSVSVRFKERHIAIRVLYVNDKPVSIDKGHLIARCKSAVGIVTQLRNNENLHQRRPFLKIISQEAAHFSLLSPQKLVNTCICI